MGMGTKDKDPRITQNSQVQTTSKKSKRTAL
ncbi:uncharacterized protein G2W53_011997 [Senna tora]|uniref:Uncharacterized protein n=1 Tax=Senna tora TaxID=362788 RepID=A0A834U3I0_9FABA|nr:uncharacterized protein G2W53_011997 [Senna tora]